MTDTTPDALDGLRNAAPLLSVYGHQAEADAVMAALETLRSQADGIARIRLLCDAEAGRADKLGSMYADAETERRAQAAEIERLKAERDAAHNRADHWTEEAANYCVRAEAAEARCAALTEALGNLEAKGRNFYAMVEGESPSLLEDDHNAFNFTEELDKARALSGRTER